MSHKYWGIKIFLSILVFVGAMFMSERVLANESERNNLALCAVYGEVSGVSKASVDYYAAALVAAAKDDEFNTGMAIGYAKGYLKAIAHVRQEPLADIAKSVYAKRCKIGVL